MVKRLSLFLSVLGVKSPRAAPSSKETGDTVKGFLKDLIHGLARFVGTKSSVLRS